MEQEKDYPGWFLWVWEHVFHLILGGFVLSALLIAVLLYLDHRLDQVEGRLHFAPPRAFQPVDLSKFAVTNVDVSALPVKRLLYVPAYSHVYYSGGAPLPLENTLSLRNTDSEHPLYIQSVQYFDTAGKLVKTYVPQAIALQPLQTVEFLVERRDSTGGSGANFLVAWASEAGVSHPVAECVMVGTVGAQAMCFARNGIDISSPENHAAASE